MNKNIAAALLLVLISIGVKAKAQTVEYNYGPVAATLTIPCINNNFGEDVTFSANLGSQFYTQLDAKGKTHGFFTWAGTLTGTGSKTGIKYKAVGARHWSFKNWVRWNPDHTPNSDGDFIYIDSFFIQATTKGVKNPNHVFDHVQRVGQVNYMETEFSNEVACDRKAY